MSADTCRHGRDIIGACKECDVTYLAQQPFKQEYALALPTKLAAEHHAAGYAEAVADVVAWHQEERKRLLAQAEEQKSGGWRHQESYLRDRAQQHADIIKRLQNGAHVGAAKKGGV